jgi:hypothetical protein
MQSGHSDVVRAHDVDPELDKNGVCFLGEGHVTRSGRDEPDGSLSIRRSKRTRQSDDASAGEEADGKSGSLGGLESATLAAGRPRNQGSVAVGREGSHDAEQVLDALALRQDHLRDPDPPRSIPVEPCIASDHEFAGFRGRLGSPARSGHGPEDRR